MLFLVRTSQNHVAETEGDASSSRFYVRIPLGGARYYSTEPNTHANNILMDYVVVPFFPRRSFTFLSD